MKSIGYFLDGGACASEHFLGAVQFQICEVLGRRDASVFLEHMPESGVTYVQMFGYLRHSDTGFNLFLEICPRFVDESRRFASGSKTIGAACRDHDT